MTEEKANSWEDFERLILEKDTLRNEMRKRASPLSVSELLYRGQADAAWCLETTLDRTVSNTITWESTTRLHRRQSHESKPSPTKSERFPPVENILSG